MQDHDAVPPPFETCACPLLLPESDGEGEAPGLLQRTRYSLQVCPSQWPWLSRVFSNHIYVFSMYIWNIFPTKSSKVSVDFILAAHCHSSRPQPRSSGATRGCVWGHRPDNETHSQLLRGYSSSKPEQSGNETPKRNLQSKFSNKCDYLLRETTQIVKTKQNSIKIQMFCLSRNVKVTLRWLVETLPFHLQ